MINPLSFYKCLSEHTRLLSILLIQHHQELCVCDLISALKLSQPKISRHLAELRKCQILVDERRGKWVYYQINPALPDWAKQVLAISAEVDYQELNLALNRLADEKACCDTPSESIPL